MVSVSLRDADPQQRPPSWGVSAPVPSGLALGNGFAAGISLGSMDLAEEEEASPVCLSFHSAMIAVWMWVLRILLVCTSSK